VEVEVIASFKKMQSLTMDRSLIVKAMQHSSLVEVSFIQSNLRYSGRH